MMGELMSSTKEWEAMLDAFRQLGGTASNITQRRGDYGNGIFPIDPAQPIDIHVPDHLLVDSDRLVLDGEDLVVDPAAGVPAEVREFIARYQKYFSWGGDGRSNVEHFERGLQALPDAVSEKLKRLGLLDLARRHEGQWLQVLRRQFLQSRRIRYKDRTVSMPIIELINHSAHSPGYNLKDGIRVSGRFAGEVTVLYSGDADALMRFMSWGFAHPERRAYSLPVRLKLGQERILVGRETSKTEKKGSLVLPQVQALDDGWAVSALVVGDQQAPRLPRTLLRKLRPGMPAEATDELFDRIRNANIVALCDLLEAAEEAQGEVGRGLRQAARLQLRTLSHCHGVRPDA
jgi:hypothetical protein